MGELTDFFDGLATAAKRLDAMDRGETNPLRIVEAMLGRETSTAEAEQWWHLFGLDERPETRPVLAGAWRRWAARHHPDKGGDAISFAHMRALFETMSARLPGR